MADAVRGRQAPLGPSRCPTVTFTKSGGQLCRAQLAKEHDMPGALLATVRNAFFKTIIPRRERIH